MKKLNSTEAELKKSVVYKESVYFRRIKAGEKDQPEELSSARNDCNINDDNEGEKFDDEKHCKTLSGVLMNSNETQSQNKNRLYIS